MIGNNKYAECSEQCLVHRKLLISQSCENGDGDNDDDCTEGIGDCDDDHGMKMIIIIVSKKSKDIRACSSDMLQLTFCVCLR